MNPEYASIVMFKGSPTSVPRHSFVATVHDPATVDLWVFDDDDPQVAPKWHPNVKQAAGPNQIGPHWEWPV